MNAACLKVLVTGAAGFIGSTLSIKLAQEGHEVVGIDNLNSYYDVGLKKARLARLDSNERFRFVQMDIADRARMERLFADEKFDVVVNLAAQAGVRYSIENPHAYIDANITGFLNVLEGCRHNGVKHLVYASTSSVYGANTAIPFSEHQVADHPVSLYGATKRSNELMAHSYSYLFKLPTTGLRFFTVYGPWGRPDMALFLFARKILKGEKVDIFNYGKHKRDFTYVDDIVEGVYRVATSVAPAGDSGWDGRDPDPSSSRAPFKVYNIGNSQPVELMRYLEVLERCLGKKADVNLLPMQAGDVEDTFADVSELAKDYGFRPQTSVEVGVEKFVRWYLDYYK